MTQIIIPISTDSPFFPKEDYYFPKPLVSVDNKPLIIKVIENLKNHINPSKFIFIMPEILDIEYSLGTAIELACKSEVEIILRKGKTSGGLCSALLAIDHINDKEDLVVSNMDDLIDYDLNEILFEFKKNKADAGLISFESSHPRWSYIKTSPENSVLMNVEKRVISKLAVAGFYYFRNKSLLIQNSMQVMLDDNMVKGSFYLSSTINQMILKGHKVLHKTIPNRNYHSLYSPESIKEYEESLHNISKDQKSDLNKVNIVIPAAGKGSRFADFGWKSPKPFIEINDKPMLSHVINNIYFKNSELILILQNEHIKNKKNLDSLSNIEYKLLTLHKVTEGTACTVMKAHKLINNENPLLIANSDQLVNFSCEEFVNDCISRGLDGSILVFKNEDLNPKWSYVKLNNEGLVSEVAEKKAISDLATVGVYFFKNGSKFCNSALDMIIDNSRVNGEFYVCPVYNYMIKSGLKIGIFEVKPCDMNGIGTPEDLMEFINLRSYKVPKDAPE